MPNRPLVFEFESEVDRDQAVDVITPILKEAQRKGKAPMTDPQQPASGLQGPQAALKQKLLQEDRCLTPLLRSAALPSNLKCKILTGTILSERKKRVQGACDC